MSGKSDINQIGPHVKQSSGRDDLLKCLVSIKINTFLLVFFFHIF